MLPLLHDRAAPRLLGAACVYAVAELAAAILIGNLFEWGRAEALLFLAFRPWLLLAAAALVGRWPWQERAVFYLLALLLAGTSEVLLLFALGAGDPWTQTLRGLAAGALLLVIMDPLLRLSARLLRRWGRALAAGVLALLFLTPLGLRPYEALLIPPRPAEAPARPDLMLMTALPLIWGEKGAFDPESRPAAAYKALEREFSIRPLDALSPETLSGGGLLLLAQPRALAPQELVALDAWIRSGGRALILSDPLLMWPSELPLGDPRRPPAFGLLAPLLSHWGLDLEPPEGARLEVRYRTDGSARRRLVLAGAGRIVSSNTGCVVEPQAYLARCRIGRGQIILLSDADLLQDGLWIVPAERGDERHRRLADNPLVVADLLDRLAGMDRPRIDSAVQWASSTAGTTKALALAALPIAVVLILALTLRLRRRLS